MFVHIVGTVNGTCRLLHVCFASYQTRKWLNSDTKLCSTMKCCVSLCFAVVAYQSTRSFDDCWMVSHMLDKHSQMNPLSVECIDECFVGYLPCFCFVCFWLCVLMYIVLLSKSCWSFFELIETGASVLRLNCFSVPFRFNSDSFYFSCFWVVKSVICRCFPVFLGILFILPDRSWVTLELCFRSI